MITALGLRCPGESLHRPGEKLHRHSCTRPPPSWEEPPLARPRRLGESLRRLGLRRHGESLHRSSLRRLGESLRRLGESLHRLGLRHYSFIMPLRGGVDPYSVWALPTVAP